MQPLYKCVPTAKDGILEGTLPKVSNKGIGFDVSGVGWELAHLSQRNTKKPVEHFVDRYVLEAEETIWDAYGQTTEISRFRGAHRPDVSPK